MHAAPDCLVINTGPLIALARVEALELVGRLPFRMLCPPQVRAELDAGARAGYLKVTPPWLVVEPLMRPLDPVASVNLDAGEAAVIQLALEQSGAWACLDDLKARRTALAVGLRVTGTLGLLARAKQSGLLPALRPLVERLQRDGIWFSSELLELVLKDVGE